MCAAVCPVDAISIHMDQEGFYRPTVEESLCINCGLCRKVCYKYDPEILPTPDSFLSRTTLLAASAQDDCIVAQTTSGGVADLLAQKLVSEGYKCIGVAYDPVRSMAYDTIASTQEQTTAFRGSKYIQSYTVNAFKELVRHCKDVKYAVFGTPCHIYAIDRFLNFKGLRGKCLLIDLYCHGCPSFLIWGKYIQEVKTQFHEEEIKGVVFRSKEKGWGNYVTKITTSKAKIISNHSDIFYELFFSDLLLNEACSDCHLRSTLQYTDIRLGDFWGKRYATNTRGVSAVSIVTQAGQVAFDKIRTQLDYIEESYSNFLPYQSWNKTYHPIISLRKELIQQISDSSLPLEISAKTIYQHQSVKQRLKRHIKTLLQFFPDRVIREIKRIYY